MLKDLYDRMHELTKLLLPKCNGVRYEGRKPNGVIIPTKCMLVLHYLFALIEALIPEMYWWLDLDSLDIKTEYIDFVKWYLDNLDIAVMKGLGVLFYGENGIGKTSLMCEIGKYAIIKGHSVSYFTAQQYIQALKEDNKTLINNFEKSKFILLDELDKVYIKKGSNFVKKSLEDFLRRMTSQKKVLIMCTNLDQIGFTGVFGESTVSMLKRELKFMEIKGKDYGETLQNKWTDEMGSELDYFSEPIVKNASELWKNEQEESLREWDAYYNRKNI